LVAGPFSWRLAPKTPAAGPTTATRVIPHTMAYLHMHLRCQDRLHRRVQVPGSSSRPLLLDRAGVGVIGTALANSSGARSFNDTGTMLPEGTADFCGEDLTGTNCSLPSDDFPVTVDLTPPSVTVAMPFADCALNPPVQVTATDLYGIPTGTTFTLDVDLNNDGNYTDAGETGYASGTLTDGHATLTLPALPGPGTYTLRGNAYNARGWRTQQTDPTGAVTSTAYDRAGDATTVTDALGHTTTAYYEDNRPTAVTVAYRGPPARRGGLAGPGRLGPRGGVATPRRTARRRWPCGRLPRRGGWASVNLRAGQECR
jgi:YD repeat-containing protein